MSKLSKFWELTTKVIFGSALFCLTLFATYAVQTGVDFNEVVGDIALDASGAVTTQMGAGDTALLQAYDVDGATYATFATLTANNTPTFDLASTTTIGSETILNSSSIGSSVQAWDDDLDDIAGLTPTDGNVLTGDGTNWTSSAPAGGGGGAGGCDYMVCASDAVDTTSCDGIGDGTADDVEIQAGITAVSVDQGGTVCLSTGTFDIDADIILASSLRLVGAGYGTVLQKSSATNTLDNSVASNDVEISNIRFSDSGEDSNPLINFTNSSTGVFIHNNWFDTSTTMIEAKLTDSIISNNYFHSGDGEYTIDCTSENLVIADNYFEIDAGVNSRAIDIGISSDTVVTGNSIIMSTSSCSSCEAVSINGGTRNVVNGNYIKGSQYGVRVSSGTNVSGNLFYDTMKSAIYGGMEKGGAVTDNVFYDTGSTSYDIMYISTETHNALIAGNSVSGFNATSKNADSMVYFNNANSDLNMVTGNNCPTCDNGVVDFTACDGKLNFIYDNGGEQRYNDMQNAFEMKNADGDAMAVGDIVILKAVTAGDEVTHTTTAGDDNVFGMVAEAIPNTAYGYVQTVGYTEHLKVNGTTAIAVGDFISTYTEAGIGKKASAGDTAIAIALEAYATADSAGVIDALIIPPRSVGN